MSDMAKKILSKYISEDLVLGKSDNQDDSFFDALSQVVNEINQIVDNTCKSLRVLCSEFYLQNKELVDNWNTYEGHGINYLNGFYPMIQYANDEYAKVHSKLKPIGGRPNVEGKILCRQLKLAGICIIEILPDYESQSSIVNFQLITENDSKSISEDDALELLKNEKIPKIVFEKSSSFFMPLLSASKILQKLADINPPDSSQGDILRDINFSDENSFQTEPQKTIQFNSISNGHAQFQPSVKYGQNVDWKKDFDAANQFYIKGKYAYITGDKRNAAAFFQQAKDGYKDLKDEPLDAKAKARLEKRLANLKGDGKYSSVALTK